MMSICTVVRTAVFLVGIASATPAAAVDLQARFALLFDSADVPEIVVKTEGMALLGDGSLALINDDDFGITGGRTQIVMLRGTDTARR
jgi:hypothetical protein